MGADQNEDVKKTDTFEENSLVSLSFLIASFKLKTCSISSVRGSRCSFYTAGLVSDPLLITQSAKIQTEKRFEKRRGHCSEEISQMGSGDRTEDNVK